MKKIALIYWPKKGSTERAAHKVADRFEKGTIDMFTITGIDAAGLSGYDAFIIGGSTTGADNWEDTHKTRWAEFFAHLGGAALSGKPFAQFGLGDQVLYPNHFVDGMRTIKEQFEKHGAAHKGLWPVAGYEFQESDSVENGMFYGLALDTVNQDELTDSRIENWVSQLKKEFGI